MGVHQHKCVHCWHLLVDYITAALTHICDFLVLLNFAYPHMCWQPQGSWRAGWCGTHLRCHSLPACLWLVWRYLVPSHSYSSSAWRSSPVLLYNDESTLIKETLFFWLTKTNQEARIGSHFFSSISLPRARHDCSPMVISVSMSAIFFCISWFLASGTPNWILIGEKKNHENGKVITINMVFMLTILFTCPKCTVVQHESRILQLPELPRQYHTGHCSDNQRGPGNEG